MTVTDIPADLLTTSRDCQELIFGAAPLTCSDYLPDWYRTSPLQGARLETRNIIAVIVFPVSERPGVQPVAELNLTGDGGVLVRAVISLPDTTQDGTLLISTLPRILVSQGQRFVRHSQHISFSSAAPPTTILWNTTASAEPHTQAVNWIKEATNLPWDRVADLLGVTRQAIKAWRDGGPIAAPHRRHLLAVREVLERALRLNPRPADLASWLDTPRGNDGRTPAQLLSAGEFDRARLLALAKASPKVKTPASWSRRPVAEAFQQGVEHRMEAVPPDIPPSTPDE